MPGPPPKPAHLRQRTNRKTSAARLKPLARVKLERVPELPERRCMCLASRPVKPEEPCKVCLGTGIVPWHRLTVAWWRSVWTSEVREQYLQVDVQGLYRLAILVDAFWTATECGGSVRELAAEIRLQQMAFGMTPLDRSRLQWEVSHPEERQQPKEDEAPPIYDSRQLLRAIK